MPYTKTDRIIDYVEQTYKPFELFRTYDVARALDMVTDQGWQTVDRVIHAHYQKFEDVEQRERAVPGSGIHWVRYARLS